nr:MAG TPA: hypothetical protein [Caudoviricetes sp.]
MPASVAGNISITFKVASILSTCIAYLQALLIN